MKIEHFEDIEAQQLARELTHKYGLKRQIQEAAESATYNIAECFDSETNR